jgi:hypothetical protein
MNFSAKIKLRRPPRRDGTCAILLQVIVGGIVWPKSLDLGWPELFFDEERGVCLTAVPAAARPPNYKQVLEAAVAAASSTCL